MPCKVRGVQAQRLDIFLHDVSHGSKVRPFVFTAAAELPAKPCRFGKLGPDGGIGSRSPLCLGRRFAWRRVVRYLNLAEIESHAGHVLRNPMRRWQGAEVWGEDQRAGLDHRRSRLSRPGEAVTMAGTATIAMKAMARMSSWNISVLLCKQRNSFTSSGLRNFARGGTW